MSRYIKVSALSMKNTVNHSGNLKGDLQSETERMIASWKGQLNIVLPNKPDVILLPEVCDEFRNYPLERKFEYYDVRKDQVLDFFKEQAKMHSCYIAYSAIKKMDDGTYRNATQLIGRTGEVEGLYFKNHPTIDETKDKKILPGKDADVIECDFGRVACGICFDLNFDPLWSKYKPQKPELILFSSAYHGGLMQNYRTYQCRSYFVGSIMNIHNTVINPVGETVARSTNYFGYLTHEINLDYKVVHLDYNWGKLSDAVAKYGSKVKVHDPGFLGSVLMTSETDEFTIDEIIDEFKIECLDDYFDRCLDFHATHVEE